MDLPRREAFFPSPVDWRNEVLYFLLPDRFSDGQDKTRPLLDRTNLAAARPASLKFDEWAESGDRRFQGGTIAGITSRLDYLAALGVTTLWVGPVFKQRGHLDTYHGYAIQDFLDVDPRFGTRKDLVDLVDAAHGKNIRVIRHLIGVRKQFPALRYGRQYVRPISPLGGPFGPGGAGEVIAWARILDDEEAVCVVNGNGGQSRGGDVLVDGALNAAAGAAFRVVANSAEAAAKAAGVAYTGTHPVGQTVPVKQRDGNRYVEVREVAPAEVLVFTNRF